MERPLGEPHLDPGLQGPDSERRPLRAPLANNVGESDDSIILTTPIASRARGCPQVETLVAFDEANSPPMTRTRQMRLDSMPCSRFSAFILIVCGACSMAIAQTTGNWTSRSPATFPPARGLQAMVYDSWRTQIVVFGGTTQAATDLQDTWIWDGANWTPKTPASAPSARHAAATAFDAARGQMVIFGGEGPSGTLNDTWVWDGANWTEKSPQTSPPARRDASMAYDSVRQQVVLFGGETPAGQLMADTWVWDGINWTQKLPSASPDARHLSSMVWDAGHGQIVLFGGIPVQHQFIFEALNDTWVWDGTNWTNKNPQTSPSQRFGTQMAYDSAHSATVLFGGIDAYDFAPVGDTWQWDGSNWTQQFPQTTPTPTGEGAIVYDPTHDQSILFGGSILLENVPNSTATITDITNNVWSWTLGSGMPAITTVQTAGAFGAFPTLGSGSWIEIYGSNLATTPARQWTSADFNGNTAPTILDNVQVKIAGQNAFIDYVSAGQVNAQLPLGLVAGNYQIVVSNALGNSAAMNVSMAPTKPGLLAPPSFKIGNTQYIVGVLPDGTYVLPPGAIVGLTTRQAKPGETVTFYGVGFAAVTPAINAGQIATQLNQLTSPVQVLFAQTPAQISYQGLAPGSVGLYQFDVMVPAISDSDTVPLTISQGGVNVPQKLYTAVHH
jgi:uncharacterized protein (TIGR03437 family)